MLWKFNLANICNVYPDESQGSCVKRFDEDEMEAPPFSNI
jgi:hypothetical protein